MKINELHIKSFGSLNDCKINFSGGVNVIFGLNEAGKTTVFNFIIAMLYGIGKSSGKRSIESNLRKRYMPWGENTMSGVMTVEHSGSIYRIERCFGKTSAGDSLRIDDITSAKSIELPKGKEVGELFFGINGEAFRGTAFIGRIPRDDVSDNSSVKAVLSNLSSCGDTDYSYDGVKKILDSASREITRNTQNGMIYSVSLKKEKAEAENRELSKELSRLEALNEENLLKSKELNGLNQNIFKLRRKISEQKEIAIALRYKNACDCLRKLKDASADFEKYKELTESNGFRADKSYTEELKELALKKNTAKERAESKRRERDAFLEHCKRLKSEEYRKIKKPKLAFCEAAGIVLFVALPALYFVFKNSVLLFFAVAFAVGIICLVCFGIYENSKEKMQISVRNAEIEEAEEELKKSKEEYICLSEKFKSRFSDFFNPNDENDADEKIKKLEEYIYCYAVAKDRYECALKNTPAEKEFNELKELVKSIGFDFSAEKIPIGEFELRLLGNEEKRLLSSVSEIKETIAGNKREIMRCGDIRRRMNENDIEIEQLNEKISRYRYCSECIDLAIKGIDEANELMKKSYAPGVNKYSSEILCKITEGKYSSLYVMENQKNGGIETVLTDESSNSNHEDGYMSTGTVDQIYLALRLGIVKFIYGNSDDVCILMDDALLNFDDIRMEAAVSYISEELSKCTQVLFFTCRNAELESFEKSGANVLEL